MPRLEPVSLDAIEPTLTDLITAARERLPHFLNQITTLAHHPPLATDLVTMYLGFQEYSVLDRRLVELAILTVSRLNDALQIELEPGIAPLLTPRDQPG